jgi:hypothetical protein
MALGAACHAVSRNPIGGSCIRLSNKPATSSHSVLEAIGLRDGKFVVRQMAGTRPALRDYYICLASGTPQQDCHAELDACLIRNGCSILP